jgi:hypothetical protein
VPLQVSKRPTWHRKHIHWVIVLSESETRDLAELKKDLEDRITRAEKELSLLRLTLRLVDEVLAKVSFKPASKLMEQQPPVAPKPAAEQKMPAPKPADAKHLEPMPAQKYNEPEAVSKTPVARTNEPAIESEEQGFPIKSKSGDDLGTLYVGASSVKIVPRADLRFSARTPPFQSFFIDRVIGEMRRKDEMAVDAGSKDPMAMIEHEVVLDGEIIREITIKNIDEDARVRELRSSIRWTFERMLEKATRP